MVETNIILSIKSTYPAASCILCHLPVFQADSERFRRVSVIQVSRPLLSKTVSAMLEARKKKKSVEIIPSVLIPS